ncbi:hypothetical protein FACS1894206_07180 [Deltaproteobacteria bacterium]|nr:hypothetical protein FACS1894206_07180 [Deltaproteobacteria bacterium]
MKQKIEWYREVLEIEPNSKIFFPLARMLDKDARPDEAIAVLRQGVGRHPDHVEARLFFAELLYRTERVVELQQELTVLSDLFRNYPGFWQAWGERLFDEETTRDAGLAAMFLAAFLQNMPVSWAGIIEHGLKSLVNGVNPVSPAGMREAHPLMPAPAREKIFPMNPPLSPHPAASAAVPSSPQTATQSLISAAVPAMPVAEENDINGDDDEIDESITLRTRSMAEILAEQGDIAGALDIYAELLAAGASVEEKAEIQARMDALSGDAALGDKGTGGTDKDSPDDKKDWLAILAQRLEARSLQ